jgi:signal transduction histidine kinase
MAIADSAALAAENARLRAESAARLEEIEHRRRLSEGLRDLLWSVNSRRGLDEILDLVLTQAIRLLGCDAAAVYTREPPLGDLLAVRAARGLDPDQTAGRLRLGTPVTGLAVQQRRPLVCTDLRLALDDAITRQSETQLEESEGYGRVLRFGPRMDPDLDPTPPTRTRRLAARFRAVLATPLLDHENAVGSISLFYAQPRSFSHDEVVLADTFAQQAMLAIASARLHEQSDRRLRELEALFRADQALYSSLVLDDVLRALVDVGTELLGADKGAVVMWDPDQPTDRLEILAPSARGFSQDMLAATLHGEDARQIRARFQAQEVIEISTERSRLPNALRAMYRREGIRSSLSAPIAVAGQVYGAFGVSFVETRAFDEEEKRLVLALGQRAGLAVQNARLYGAADRRLREIDALYRADEVLHRSLRLDDVLQALADVAVGVLGADKTSVHILDNSGRRLVPAAAVGYTTDSLALALRPGEEPIVAEVLSAEILVVRDPEVDPRVPENLREIARRESIRAAMSAPIKLADQLFGLFTVAYCRPHPCAREEQRLVLALAQRAALAIQNARLYEQAQAAAAAEERQRLARELHDAVTQTLFSASLIAEVAPKVWDRNPTEGRRRMEELRLLTRGALAEMRTLLLELRPAALIETPLTQLLQQLADATASRSRLKLEVAVEGTPRAVPAEVQIGLYRVAQEALNNSTKHAHASRASLVLAYAPEHVQLSIEDDGDGFDPGAVGAGRLGLNIMDERTRAVGASLHIQSEQGQGTHITVRWPGL